MGDCLEETERLERGATNSVAFLKATYQTEMDRVDFLRKVSKKF